MSGVDKKFYSSIPLMREGTEIWKGDVMVILETEDLKRGDLVGSRGAQQILE